MSSETGLKALIATIMQAHAFPIPLLSEQGAAWAAENLVCSPEPEWSSQGFCRAKPRLCRSSSFQLRSFNFSHIYIPKQEAERSCGDKDFRGKRALFLLTLKSYQNTFLCSKLD